MVIGVEVTIRRKSVRGRVSRNWLGVPQPCCDEVMLDCECDSVELDCDTGSHFARLAKRLLRRGRGKVGVARWHWRKIATYSRYRAAIIWIGRG